MAYRIRINLADGATNQIEMAKTRRSAAVNFVHAMDASHLVRVVNAATSPLENINDILVVHDSFACHAPHAVKLNRLIRRELAILYEIYDPIAHICERNPSNITPPETGNLDPLDVENSEWVCI